MYANTHTNRKKTDKNVISQNIKCKFFPKIYADNAKDYIIR